MVYTGLSTSFTFRKHFDSRSVAAVSLGPVSRACARYVASLVDDDVVRAVIPDDVIVTRVEEFYSSIPDKPNGFVYHLRMNIVTAHNVHQPTFEFIILPFQGSRALLYFSERAQVDQLAQLARAQTQLK